MDCLQIIRDFDLKLGHGSGLLQEGFQLTDRTVGAEVARGPVIICRQDIIRTI